MELYNIKKDIIELIENASELAGNKLNKDDFEILLLDTKHTPPKLPDGKMAVYSYVYNGRFLKVGQANINSGARYKYTHYKFSKVKSSLPNSLLNDPEMKNIVDFNDINSWIRNNCKRVDVILDGKLGKFTLNLIEGLLHYKYKPKYEGNSIKNSIK